MTRRQLLGSGIAAIAFRNEALAAVERAVSLDPVVGADDEAFWAQIQAAFTLNRNVANFNNGGCSPSPRVVHEAMKRAWDYSNQAPSHYMWRQQEQDVESVRRRLAAVYGCDPEELAITRNASEALETVLLGYPLEAGDEVLTTDLDYPRMLTTLDQRARRDGIVVKKLAIPAVPSSPREIIRAFRDGISPKTRLILISQVGFQNGHFYPVREVVRLAHERKVPVLVDGAHGFVHAPETQPELQADFYGASLHKWLMAPLGTGMLFVKKDLIPKVWPLMAAPKEMDANIRKFEEIGTHPAAIHNAIGEALTFHELLGTQRRRDRLHYLQFRWINPLREEPKVRFHTSLRQSEFCGLVNVEIVGVHPSALAGWLLDRHGIFVTTTGNDRFQGIRISPNVYTTVAEVDRLRDALLLAARHGIGIG